MPPRRRRHGLELGLILLLNELLQFGMRNIPPVTLSTIVGQVCKHFIFKLHNIEKMTLKFFCADVTVYGPY